jgi:glycosyltransferase involved in cell wall biosynthesis
MTRVLMVADGLWNGGAERQLALLASSLPEPWSASVLSMQDGPYRQVLEGLGLDLRLAPRHFRFDVTPAVRMWRAAAGIGPDIVHSWGWMSTMAMVPFCRARGIPLLNGTIRRGDLPPRRAAMYRLSQSLSDAVVANSRAGLAAFGIAEDGRGHVVYNGFDPDRLATIAAHTAAGGAGPPRAGLVAIMAARMVEAKDWRLLLEAARILAMDTPGIGFVAMGDGPDRADLMSIAADLVSTGTVGFPESGLEALPAIAAADVGVLLSDPRVHAEGCSNAILEYMACGLPVVCTDSGGNPELVEHGVTGLLVAPRDVDAIVAALRSLRDDPAQAKAMGLEGRRRLHERFTVEGMVAGYVHVYEELLARRGMRLA